VTNTAEQAKIGVDDYLAGEEAAPVKHEYVAGEVFAIAGAGEAHVTVAGNLFALLRNHVRSGPCRVYISDMKVRAEQADAFYYPDLFVTCDPADSREKRFKRNPILVVEVLSDSTAAFDCGAKFAHYRQSIRCWNMCSSSRSGRPLTSSAVAPRGGLGPTPGCRGRGARARRHRLPLPTGRGLRRRGVRLARIPRQPAYLWEITVLVEFAAAPALL